MVSIQTPAHLGGHFNVTHIDEGALTWLIREHGVESMLDLGCGPGGMMDLASRKGLRVLGLDGDPQIAETRHEDERFVEHDFSVGGAYTPEGEYDLCWSVEFLEHLAEQWLPHIQPVLQACRLIVCTAAPPGWPGPQHYNCQPQTYWRAFFATRLKPAYWLDEEGTQQLEAQSTMQREFIRRRGMLFRRGECEEWEAR